jgi:hypothetical protein
VTLNHPSYQTVSVQLKSEQQLLIRHSPIYGIATLDFLRLRPHGFVHGGVAFRERHPHYPTGTLACAPRILASPALSEPVASGPLGEQNRISPRNNDETPLVHNISLGIRKKQRTMND